MVSDKTDRKCGSYMEDCNKYVGYLRFLKFTHRQITFQKAVDPIWYDRCGSYMKYHKYVEKVFTKFTLNTVRLPVKKPWRE